ncbi:hapless 2 [Neodiprion lecontei]|uniref:Hapless 2 n=1 Tax=Neodiprion lecontei TaxID=441921 RepID=A0ABM3FWK3_NEOLC|nr:hapless 2 [Neodiprion lecontei]
MNAEKLASVTNGGGGEGVVKEKRRTQRLTGGKIVTKRKSKRHKHKKDKKKKKRKKNKKVEKSTDNVEPSKTKTKWWPFKRSLLNTVEDQQLPKDIDSHRPSKKLDRNSISRAETERQTKKGRSKRRKKRQLQAGGVQVRGGQDCMDRHHPARVNPVKYQESAHCLRFSDLWYSVYELENPIMEHTVYLQLFEKHTLPDGSTHWDDLTQGSMVRLGTFVRRQRDSAPTITFTYSGAKVAPVKEAHNLDPEKDRLLVPSPVPAEKLSKYPEAKGGSDEFLVVQSSVINKNGNECDKGGVGFATFATQPNRCGQPKGTCLKNQPLAYWRHDVEARDTGKPGCYFLSNFASVPSNPIKYNVSGTGSREYLGLEYHSLHVSAVDVEVRADYNAIVRVGSSGRVTEVHVDSTAPEHTVVTIVVSNMGLASCPYQPRISDCPTGLPISWSKAKGAMQVIPPQHDQRVTLDLYGQLDVNGFHCSVEVINHHGELVAMRRIRVQKMDRCFCVWHCLCACVGSVAGLGCQPMSTEHYHAAGFQGPVPVPSMESSVLANTIKDVLILSALLVLLLLILGMLKWFVGIFFPVVSRWGLDTLLEGGCKIEGYFEPELRCCSIVTDSEGRIVHPETGRRSVRICRRRTEFLLNLVLFLTWPVAVCHKRCRGSLAARRERCYSDESKICLLKEEGDGDSCCGRKLISVNTYGDCRNSKMEDEDTRYVMNELKRSRDSLQDGGKRCKSCRSLTISQDYSSRNSCLTEQSALEFVAQLLNIRVVFRNLKHPIGGLNVPVGTPYSLRGYFMNAENGGYRFITACPFKQHWLIDNGFNKKPLKPARTYPSNQFMRTFADAEEVLRSEEISLKPKGICLNVQFPDQE